MPERVIRVQRGTSQTESTHVRKLAADITPESIRGNSFRTSESGRGRAFLPDCKSSVFTLHWGGCTERFVGKISARKSTDVRLTHKS